MNYVQLQHQGRTFYSFTLTWISYSLYAQVAAGQDTPQDGIHSGVRGLCIKTPLG